MKDSEKRYFKVLELMVNILEDLGYKVDNSTSQKQTTFQIDSSKVITRLYCLTTSDIELIVIELPYETFKINLSLLENVDVLEEFCNLLSTLIKCKTEQTSHPNIDLETIEQAKKEFELEGMTSFYFLRRTSQLLLGGGLSTV